ncbi:NAD dependent epimerase/dehydratase [Vibrio phage vB_VchM_Kuja]|uniref:NAD dependent epimerase/dehydratase n=1 Tax=Vibrio phage vB_VchM_Kuja TaxID=2686437 RepID=A0A6B9JAX9_9CAUD|nr:nucleotide-sugar epimerase [Vibrio phage vB_VchM_Kuja]QGZ16126.1 NAD dependent epimerase/dehydratase [Vibrio phage vB_VchM_Kuja]
MKKQVVLVTGGAGFIGSHLCEALVNEGYEVHSLDNYSTGSMNNHVSGVTYHHMHTFEIYQLEITPDIIFHLGEYSRVEESFDDVDKVFQSNVVGTRTVFNYVRDIGAKIVYAGSSTAFGDATSPYSLSKSQNVETLKEYAKWYDIDYAITYFYNVYGPREISNGRYGTVIGIFRSNMFRGKPLNVTLPGNQERNFTHVSDIVDGLIRVGKHGSGDLYGIGHQDNYSILDVATMFGGEIKFKPERMGNRMSAKLHTDAVRELGWSPKHDLPSYINQLKLDNWIHK